MIWLLAGGVLAQGLDAVTLRFDHEANPLVLGLGPSAYLAKILLIVAIPVLATSLPLVAARLPTSSRASWLLQSMALTLSLLLLVAGLLGTISNLLAA